jgi:hypothetical protein
VARRLVFTVVEVATIGREKARCVAVVMVATIGRDELLWRDGCCTNAVAVCSLQFDGRDDWP